MSTVRDVCFDFLRRQGMTTVFGNPGSTELTFLAGMPADFRYVLGLQEATVVAMADGYAQASGRPTLVNLHTAPGVGNAMGAIYNAQANHTPLVITAGQQVRAMITLQANLTNRDATRVPESRVKWSFEPPRAEDVPHALARAVQVAALPPQGPVFLSVPMDDWTAPIDPESVKHVLARSVSGRAGADPAAMAALRARLAAAVNPVLVAGPEIDAAGAWDLAVELAERQRLPVWASPAIGGRRQGFPEHHAQFRGVLPGAIGPLSHKLRGHDLILVVGAPVFSYYPYVPGQLLPEGAELVAITSDPDQAARAPMGDAIVADVRFALELLLDGLEEATQRPMIEPLPAVPELPDGDPLSGTAAVSTLAGVWPEDGILVAEAPSVTGELRRHIRLSGSASYYFCAGNGLGFALPAAIGVKLARPDRPVVCVLGDGSAHYAIQALWTAAHLGISLTILVLKNREYAILKWFGEQEDCVGAPGLDLPGLDTAAVARGYGVPSVLVQGRDELRSALLDAFGAQGPHLVEVEVAPGMTEM
jgi:benzoylformate decarboxylase